MAKLSKKMPALMVHTSTASPDIGVMPAAGASSTK
jgi:hypothetical protein